jgi:hypothetical protein
VRRPDRADGRSSFAVLTPAGKAALRRAWPVYREAIRRHLGARLTAQQCRQLATLLEQAATGGEAGPPGIGAPPSTPRAGAAGPPAAGLPHRGDE